MPDRSVQQPTQPPTFAELGVAAEIVGALADNGIERVFSIQELTLPIALTGRDLIGQARTGMGKTLAFGVALLDRVFDDAAIAELDGTPRALVITPTRELAVQVGEDLALAAKNTPIRLSTIYGGRPYDEQLSALSDGVDVVVGTPGRLLDLHQRGDLDLSQVAILVLDEADEMLDLGFLPDIQKLWGALNQPLQTMLFSATMPGQILTLARSMMNKPLHIRAEATESSQVHDTTKQVVFCSHKMDKPEVTARILQAEGRGKTIIFTRTKRTAAEVSEDLAGRGFAVGSVHGDLGQEARERSLDAFRRGDVEILVATDVAARGIDVDDVTHVINYQTPDDPMTYVHRIGRTGRAGRTGTAVTLVGFDEGAKWKLISDELSLDMPEPPTWFSTSPELRDALDIPENAGSAVGPARSVHGVRKKRDTDSNHPNTRGQGRNRPRNRDRSNSKRRRR
ncbi:DEAD/DEAH box helicase [Corynebacterium urinipleomorphum]|uniref:DEAD/DEAH box helicase n=1 Tax=Corynebacterium urinipleomorphum TaxID=1852380 RepID=UPI000B35C14D|nr:DEAD/DEAH box helicase [Corynebacterium urinipleomorphum]